MNAPAGWTTVDIAIAGRDMLDGSKISCNYQLHWLVCYQRIFVIETEHEFQEQAGVPFALHLWACLPNGEVDTSYQGNHRLQFEYTESIPSTLAPPKIPKEIELFFQQGMSVTRPEFTLYDSTTTVQVSTTEIGPGGPSGESEAIAILPGEFYTFELILHSPQIAHCPFHGKNFIRAID